MTTMNKKKTKNLRRPINVKFKGTRKVISSKKKKTEGLRLRRKKDECSEN